MIRLTTVVTLLATLLSVEAEAGYIDSINPNADPTDFVSYGFDNVGWYYKASSSYTLTGIYTLFPQDEFGSGSRVVTVQIQSERPVNGGVLLGQGTFTADSFTGIGNGGDLTAPVQITAGVTYFVDFLNVKGLGVNLGQWADVNGTHVATNGATTRLSSYYLGGGSDTSFSTVRTGNAADQSTGFGPVSGLEPILLFSGTAASVVPEPASLILLVLGTPGLAVHLCRTRKGISV